MNEQSDNELRLLVDKCCELFSKEKKTIAFTESASAGFLAHEFSKSGYAGNVLKGGIVCYDVEVKKNLLKVPAKAIRKFTPESPEVTKMIIQETKELIKADYYVGITGLLKSGGSESPEKPVGTIFTCILGQKEEELADRALFRGDQEHILKQMLENVCRLLIYIILENKGLKIWYLLLFCHIFFNMTHDVICDAFRYE